MKITTDILKGYFYDQCSPEEEIEIQKWLTENDNADVDKIFREIIAEIKAEDRELSQKAFARFQQAVQQQTVQQQTQPVTGKKASPFELRPVIYRIQRVAAILLLPLLLLSGYLLFNKKAVTEWNDLTVAHGQRETILLSDGTRLHINSGTRVVYPTDFEGDKREIFVSGELFAEVAKNPDKPFIISAGDVHVQVLGTQFNLRAYNNLETVEVALVEGSVLFKTRTDRKEILKPGEMVQYNRKTQEVHRDTFSAEQYKCPAKHGGFYFCNLPLSDIVKELEYYFNTPIILLNGELGKSKYIAYFTNGETLDEILNNLNADGQMSVTRSEGGVILIDSALP